MIGLLHAELRRIFTTNLWWGLLIPVLLLSLLINAVIGIATAGLEELDSYSDEPVPPVFLLLSTAYTVSLASVFAAVLGAVSAGGEFRHRTLTTTYLLAGRRVRALAAKLAVSAVVGAGYAVAAVATAALTGLLSQTGTGFPAVAMVELAGVGMLVCALWAVVGAAVGTAIGNQAGALAILLIYLLVGELLASTALNQAGSEAVTAISAYLPGNAGDVALYGVALEVLIPPSGPDPGSGFAVSDVVGLLAVVTDPPAWWVGLLVLMLWTAAFGALGVLVGRQRDVS